MVDRGMEDGIRKGPWKVEEDEVLLNHVRKYGPRDWSSIRSKGLLQRTGKSCRLRWVNKLRPNLKNGCKFSAEEERVVIELQAQFGNKWAKIATYLPGRTDNDVKNFWSSRQKRLARILHSSTNQSKLQKSSKKETPVDYNVPPMEAPKFNSASEGESTSRPLTYSSSCCTENSEAAINMFPLPDLYNPNFGLGTNYFQPEFNIFEMKPNIKSESQIYSLSTLNTQTPDSSFSSQSQEFSSTLYDPYFFDVFLGPMDDSLLGNDVQFLFGPRLFEPVLSFPSQDDARERVDNPMTPESFFNEFPADLFDHIEPLPSSPEH